MPQIKRVLGGGWVEALDDQGRTYFANRNTRETRWDAPPVDEPMTASEVRATTPVPPPASSAVPMHSPVVTSTAALGDWREHVDDKTGRVYYSNRVTRETRWDRPVVEEEDDTKVLQTAAGQTIVRVGGKSSKWYKAADAKTGREYFVNLETRETRWDPPPESETPPPPPQATSRSAVSSPLPPPQTARTPATSPLASSQVGQVVNGVVQAGVGIFLEQKEVGTPLYVKQIFAGSAADRSGKLQVGDELVSVNSERVVGRTPTALKSIIVGPQGSYIRCGFLRGNTEFEVKLLRGTAEALTALSVRGLELHEELDSVRESLRLLEDELEIERRRRMTETSLRGDRDNLERQGWKDERKKLLDQLETEIRARKDAELRERKLMDERVAEALEDRERKAIVDELGGERKRIEQLLVIERERATQFQLSLKDKDDELNRLREQVRQLQERMTISPLAASLRQAEDREQGLLKALETERIRYEEQLKTEQERRISEETRRKASEEREQQLLRQLEDERFRWGEALRLEEERARLAEAAKREDAYRQIRSQEEGLRSQALSSAQQRWDDERKRLESTLEEEREKKNQSLQREQALLQELKRRNEDDSNKRSDIDTLRRAMEDDRVRLENALWEMNERLKKESDLRAAAENREAHLVSQLSVRERASIPPPPPSYSHNGGDATLKAEVEELKARLNAITNSQLSNHQNNNNTTVFATTPRATEASRSSGRDLGYSQRGTTDLGVSRNTDGGGRGSQREGARTPSHDEMQREKEKLLSGIDRVPPPSTPQSVPNLVGLLASKTSNTVREAAYALGLVAIEAEGRSSILALPQAVFRLSSLLSSPDSGTSRYAALALGNLAMDAAGRKAILNVASSIEQLASLLRSDDTETVRYAALALGNLVLEESGRTAVLSYSSSVPLLAAQLSSGDKQTVRYATGAIRNLAVEEAGRKAVVGNSGCVEMLRNLQRSGDSATARYAGAALKNLALGP